ncbi:MULTISPECIES: hypothetical protein [unclassified Tenacibaculum]|uniref:hypothetical protein n=1 Tax=unclassified Tenacibaculum TaxID=2635139 RepID=UPI001F289206|nr:MULTISPECIES: hypothetical protein [unclassified Tenacibaculum]MCF2875710.1 hypothetical protein [Tenacibaculum sp. Cn5-1]MCF2935786.1 hypothetical protein [Tenacibaculum sp. Cn5-34]MCG7512346.1 hypothetical protein [Tenacibaculum sp. Cn5-46]
MLTNLNSLLTNIQQNPKKLFLIDGFGAILSAFMLGVILVRFEALFGIPSSALYILAIIPLFFTLYDIYSFKQKHSKTNVLLKGIAILNLLYCCISLGFAFYHFNSITYIGWSYILIEITIILLLAFIEFSVGTGVKN